MQNKRRLIIVATLCLAGVFVGAGLIVKDQAKPAQQELALAFLDVGQGDAVLIRKSSQYDVLIDGGPDPTVLTRLGELLPWYDRELDWLVLTHNHADHYMGLIAVLDKYKVKRLLVSDLAEPLPPELSAALARNQVPYSKVSVGTELNLEPVVKLKVLWPLAERPSTEMNDRSLVLELDADGARAMLAGDAGEEVEQALLAKGWLREVQIFKLSHHGSDTANSEAFLEALRPHWVVAQSGAGNSFGHPKARILKRAQRLGAEIKRNDQEGTIVFVAKRGEWIER